VNFLVNANVLKDLEVLIVNNHFASMIVMVVVIVLHQLLLDLME